MGDAKNIVLKPIPAKEANALVKRVHYSGKVVQNSQIHIGVYYGGKLEGAMQFGPSLDKRKLQPLVTGTEWHHFIELNRMAFSEALPRNSESRAIAIAMKLLRKHAPQIKWVVSFADATQCGDGAIYRASGFVLTQIKENGQLYQLPFANELDAEPLKKAGVTDDEIANIRAWLASITPASGTPPASHKMAVEGAGHAKRDVSHKLTVEDRPAALRPAAHVMGVEGGHRPNRLLSEVKRIMRKVTNGRTSADTLFRLMGGAPAKGYQLRYVYFVNKAWRSRLTVEEIPYSRIDDLGAGMYRGEKR